MTQEEAVPCDCPTCGASLVVFPSSLLAEVGEKAGNVESELDFASSLAELRDDSGRRYPLADVEGNFTCPACQARTSLADL